MKLRLAPAHLATRLHHGPLRFGRTWRGHELALRLIQLSVLVLFAGYGSRFLAQGAVMLVQAIAGLFS